MAYMRTAHQAGLTHAENAFFDATYCLNRDAEEHLPADEADALRKRIDQIKADMDKLGKDYNRLRRKHG